MVALSSRSSISMRKSRGCYNSFFATLLFLIAIVAIVVRADDPAAAGGGSGDEQIMKVLDKNGDGILQQHEYDSGLNKLKAILARAANKIPNAKGGSKNTTRGSGFWKAFTSGVAMILATEIGDKTFFIAAVLSMKHPRSAVFLGAILALIIMTILSTVMGLILPSVMDRKYTHLMAGVLFMYFGCKLGIESRSMEANQVSDELMEVEEELLQQKTKKQEEDDDNSYGHQDSTVSTSSNNDGMDDEEKGGTDNNNNGTSSTAPKRRKRKQKQSWYSVAIQALTLTFLAEWGDRSQIATIALAAAKNPYGVTVGGCLGHSICTGLAVIGGRMLAKSISEKTVTTFGGTIFLLFGIHSLFFEE